MAQDRTKALELFNLGSADEDAKISGVLGFEKFANFSFPSHVQFESLIQVGRQLSYCAFSTKTRNVIGSSSPHGISLLHCVVYMYMLIK